MRLALLTLYTPEVAAMARAALYNKKDYCAVHGYEHIVERELLDRTRNAMWSKPLAILKHLERFDWIFWTDIDSLILNTSIKAESFCDDNFDLVITQDMNGLNTGQMFFRNTPRSRKFLEDVTQQTQFLTNVWGEQAAFIHLLQQGADLRVNVLPQQSCNSYLVNYRRGDFVLHLPGPINKRKWLDEFSLRTDLLVESADQLDAMARRLGLGIERVASVEDLHVRFEAARSGTLIAIEAPADDVEHFAREKDVNLYVASPICYVIKSPPVHHPLGRMIIRRDAPRRPAVQVEGWKQSTHPYALTSQLASLEMMKRDDVLVYYHEKPRPERWQQIDTLFDSESRQRLMQVPPPDPDRRGNVVLRFVQPYDVSSAAGQRTFVHIEAAMGAVPDALMTRTTPLRRAIARSDAMVLTPSKWSRRGLINSGVPEYRIRVVPHGVNASLFHPLDPERRTQLRTKARAGEDFVFLHVSDLSWSKGLDILLRAFAEVARRYPQVRLVLKGMDIPHDSAARLREAAMQLTEEQAAMVEPRMRYLGDVARFEKLANLFQIADAYVSAYRGAAFHRPALEAAACGVPLICTAGGATDDFTNESFALPVRSEERPMAIDDLADAVVLWPDESHLVEQMCRVIEDEEFRRRSRDAGPAAVANGFTWTQVVDQLLKTVLPT